MDKWWIVQYWRNIKYLLNNNKTKNLKLGTGRLSTLQQETLFQQFGCQLLHTVECQLFSWGPAIVAKKHQRSVSLPFFLRSLVFITLHLTWSGRRVPNYLSGLATSRNGSNGKFQSSTYWGFGYVVEFRGKIVKITSVSGLFLTRNLP